MSQAAQLIAAALAELNAALSHPVPLPASADVKLYGKDGRLDSIALVTLLATIESLAAERFDVNLTIADDKAFASRSSPFATVGSLAAYVQRLLDEGKS